MGALSSVGAITLYCTSAIALFSATLAVDRSARNFLIYAGILSSWLATDDFFGFHDRVLQEYHIRESFVKAALILAQVVYIVAFRKIIRRLNYPILAVALVLFAASVALDSHFIQRFNILSGLLLSPAVAAAWEDFPKLAGTVLWLWFHMLAARDINAAGQVQDHRRSSKTASSMLSSPAQD
jgi:hypothetical protein